MRFVHCAEFDCFCDESVSNLPLNLYGKMVFAKLIFFPPNFFLFRKIFLFENTQKNFGGKKINLAKKVGPIFIISKSATKRLIYGKD
jgi:hypothetical protein